MKDLTTSQAAKIFGNRSELAVQLGVSKQAITNWGEYPPWRRQEQIQDMIRENPRLTEKAEYMLESEQ